MSEPTSRLITTRLGFHDALRDAFAEMASVGCREAWISDETFADWPLNERAVIERLTQWAQSHRKLVVVARHYDEVLRRHARWVDWRRQWSHVVECRAFPDHHRYAPDAAMRLLDDALRLNATAVTTTKDHVRLPDGVRPLVTPLAVDLVFDDPVAVERVLDQVMPED